MVGDRRLAYDIDGHHVLGLGVVQRGEHKLKKTGRARLRCNPLRNGLARGTPRNNMNAQRLFLSLRAGLGRVSHLSLISF